MCSITGIINFNRLTNENFKAVKNATSLQKHRGPDHTGYFSNKNVCLGSNRLNIVGLKNGNQPIFSKNKSIVLVVNGEIYNFKELKKYLKSKNILFDRDTDVEAILRLYEFEGLKGFSRLRGMFSFCLYDQKKKLVYIFRDRVGEKPLYYRIEKNSIFFNSEFRSLVQSLNTDFVANCDAINDYLFHGFIVEPRTFAKGISKLEAGSYIEVNLKKKKIKIKKYWNPLNLKKIKKPNFEKSMQGIENIVQADNKKKVGLALSSGIDSSSLAYLFKKKNISFHSMSLYNSYNKTSEAKVAKSTMKKHKINVELVSFSDKEMIKNFTKVITSLDEPIADLASSNYYKLMNHEKKKKLKVLIFGHGVDELFWGYPDVIENLKISNVLISQKNHIIKKISIFLLLMQRDLSLRGLLRWALRRYFEIPYLIKVFSQYEKENFFPFLNNNPTAEYYDDEISKIFTYKFKKNLAFTHPSKLLFSKYKINQKNIDTSFFHILMKTYLRENGLMQLDKLSMSMSIEARTPYVDFEFVEDVFKYRVLNKDYLNPPKAKFRKILKQCLNFTHENKRKQGFEASHNMVNTLYKKFFPLLTTKSCLKKIGIFDDNKFQQLLFSKKFKDHYFYKILVLEIWLKKVFKNKKISIKS